MASPEIDLQKPLPRPENHAPRPRRTYPGEVHRAVAPPILRAEWSPEPLWAARSRRSTRKLHPSTEAGLRYQRHVVALVGRYLESLTKPPILTTGPWIRFSDEGGPGWAQPDLLLHWAPHLGLPPGPGLSPELTLVVEIKRTYREPAYNQLTKLYMPLVERLLGPRTRVVGAIVARGFERGFPGTIHGSLGQLFTWAKQGAKAGETAALRWLS